ncbi:MAG: ATP-dependent metallopeptidase FtsH/Yme1/Tma family protein, partial [Patescibacteria group bacterium]
MSQIWKNILVFLVVLVAIGALFNYFSPSTVQRQEKAGIESLVQKIQDGDVKRIDVKGDTMIVTLKDDRKETVRKESSESLSELMRNYGVDPAKLRKVAVEVQDQQGLFWLNAFLSIILPFLILGFFIFLMIRQVQGANNRAMTFGLSRARQIDSKANAKAEK